MSLVSIRSQTTKRFCTKCNSRLISSTSATRPESHDLVVVGGGPAGLALTAALASSESITANHRITLLEGNSLSSIRDWSPKKGELSNRVSSITAENRNWLNRIGVWQHVEQERTRDIREMQVWDGISDARIQFHSPTSSAASTSSFSSPSTLVRQIPAMATLTENLNLQRAALRRIEESGKVELIDGFRVEEIVKSGKEEGGWPVVRLSNKEGTKKREVRARLLIGADGANSPVKTYSDIETFGWKYDRQGVVASLNLDLSEGARGTNTAWQRFLPEGPIAFLPLSDSTASLVWSTTSTYASLFKSLPPSAFAHLINLAFCLPYAQLKSLLSHLSTLSSTSSLPSSEELVISFRDIHQSHLQTTYDPSSASDPLPPLVSSLQPSSVASFPLRLSHTSSYLGLPTSSLDLRTCLVGDAAHTIHPLAGQGLNMGLSDSSSLVSVLSRLSEEGADLGAYVGLRDYPRRRYTRNHALLSACDHLNSLYGSENRLVVGMRSNGLEVVNELPYVKELLMGSAGAETEGGRPGGGGWETVANVMDGVGKVRDMVGMVGGLVGGMVKRRAT
ncbi:putative N,N-dimethylaniline monooxygenase COQ6 [Sporobolomyces salmoneus]|uniref:putative N,N-dimethylaniline monooxygenase COQ6 n=1 Tax=Sporobolomyces salmoneus TaxID=183962 RepID=UPI0031741794